MEVHCLQCKNCQYRYLWQYPSEMSNFFSWPLFTRLDDYQNNSSLSDHLISLVLIPGGFYYCRDASSTMVHHCQKADFKESSKLLRVANRNGASQPYETFCTLTRHPNTPLGPKKPKKANTGTPSKKVLFQKMRWKRMKEYSFDPSTQKGNRRGLRWDDFETSADLLALIVFEIQQFP